MMAMRFSYRQNLPGLKKFIGWVFKFIMLQPILLGSFRPLTLNT